MMKKLIFPLLFVLGISTHVDAQKPYKAYMVSNTHLDTQWLWTVQTTIDHYLYRTLTQNFWLIDHYPGYIFNFEGAVRYQWAKEYYPTEYERLKNYIKAGRWNISGSSWDSTDPNIPSPESFFRNLLYGQEFFKKEFGKKSNDIFLPDCFGFGYTLPTIAAHSGIIGFSTQKLQHRKLPFYGDHKLPFMFGLWEGIDGARIMAVPHAQDYVSRFDGQELSNNGKLVDLAKNGLNNTVYHYYGAGDRGGSPTIASVRSVETGMKGEGPVQIISARSGQLFDDYYPFEKHPELLVFKGELLMDVHATGCYTSQAAMKLFNRRNELLADAAERASVVAEWLGGAAYPEEPLRESWQRFLWHQFHDDLTGTSIPVAYTFSWNDELIAQSEFAEITTGAVGAVSRALDTRTRGISVVVYNPVAQSRCDIVTATVDMALQPKDIVAVAPNGKKVFGQLLSWQNGKATVLFPVDMDPVSFSVYDVRSGKISGTKQLKAESNILENSIYKVVLDKNGDIASITDKRNGRELVEPGKAFRLALFTPSESRTWPAWELFKKTIDQTPLPVNGNVEISVAENGPVRASLKVKRTYGTSNFVQYITLTEGGQDDRIDIRNEIDWNERNTLLKAEFPMNVSNEIATYDLGIGYIGRGSNTDNKYEVVAQQWADITSADGSYGISVMNDSKYGWDKPDNHTLRLTLLNTPAVGKDPNMAHQEHLDMGHHTFSYSIYGHKSDIAEAGTAWKAEAFNQLLLSFTTPKHAGTLGRKLSFVKTNMPGIAIKAVKKAEDGKSYIVRVNEIYGKDFENAEIIFASAVESACEVNGIEEYVGETKYEGDKIVFSGTAFQPRTFSVRLKENACLEIPENHSIDIECNATALTADEFSMSGNFDGEGNSFAAELMPDVVEAEGVTFRMENNPADYNYIRCDGQTIPLPEKHGYTKCYLLVTSSHGDRKASFQVDGKDYSVNVPFYSGFIGQWGWTGESEGYMKDASIAYIGTHRHSSRVGGNESYIYTYLYKICLDIAPDAKALTLPKDAGVALFAVTLSDNSNDDTKPATEMRALPHETAKVEYTTEPVAASRRR